jgi:LacI family transcriptional regulator
MERATITEIAARAGVSRYSVSRILSGKPGHAADTCARVRAIAQELNYTPNPFANALRLRKTGIAGLLLLNRYMHGEGNVPQPVGFFQQFVSAMQIELINNDLQILLGAVTPEQLQRRELPSMVTKGYVDGLIYVYHADEGYARLLAARCPKLVLLEGDLPGFTSVVTDDFGGGRLAAEHLWGLGHRHFALVNHHHADPLLERRLNGFRDAVRRLARRDGGLPLFVDDAFDVAGGVQAARAFLAAAGPATALFCANDHLAVNVMRELAAAGVKVPEAVSVVGFDNAEWSATSQPALTTVDKRRPELGHLAVQQLLRLLGGDLTPQTIMLPPTLVSRGSTAAVPGTGSRPSRADSNGVIV